MEVRGWRSGQFAAQDTARVLFEQSCETCLAQALANPFNAAGHGVLAVGAVHVRRHRVGNAVFHQAARGLGFSAVVGAGQGFQIHDHGGLFAHGFREFRIALNGQIALGMGHDWQATGDPDLEEGLFEVRRWEYRIHLEKKRPPSFVTRYGVLAQAFDEDLVPKVLGSQANAHGGMVFLALGLKRVEGLRDGLGGWDEEAVPLMWRDAYLGETEIHQGLQHVHAGCHIWRSVIETRQEVAMKIDVLRHVFPGADHSGSCSRPPQFTRPSGRREKCIG